MEKELRRAVEKLRSLGYIDAVILFGSRARGDWGPWSDYDLLIIGRFREPYLDRIKTLLDTLADIRLPVEPHPYTLEEALSMLRRGNPMIIDALTEGRVLYDAGVLDALQGALRELARKGLRRTRVSIIVPE